MSPKTVVTPAAAMAFAPSEATAAASDKIMADLHRIGQEANAYARANGFDDVTRANYQHAVALDAINQVRNRITDVDTLKNMYQTVMGYEDQASSGFWQGLADVGHSLGAGLQQGITQIQAFLNPEWGNDNRAAAAKHKAALSGAAKADSARAVNASNFNNMIGDNQWNMTTQLKERPLDYAAETLGAMLPSVAGAVAGTVATATGAGAAVGVPLLAASLGVGAMQAGGSVRDDIYTTAMQMTDLELQQNSPLYNELIKSGMTPDQAKLEVATSLRDNWGEFFGSTALGAASNFLPGGQAAGGLVSKALGQLGYSSARTAASNIAREGVVGAVTEAGQQALSNKAVQDTVDQRRQISDGVAESAVLGGVLEGGIAGIGSAIKSSTGVNSPEARASGNVVDQALSTQSAPVPEQSANTQSTGQQTTYDEERLKSAASRVPAENRARFMQDFITDAKYGILDTESNNDYAKFVRDALGIDTPVQPGDAVAQPGETVPTNLESPTSTQIGDSNTTSANADTLYEPGDQAAVDQVQPEINSSATKPVTKRVARGKQTNDNFVDVNDQAAAAESRVPRSSTLDRARIKHIRGSKKFVVANDSEYDGINNVVIEPETATQPVETVEVQQPVAENQAPSAEPVKVSLIDNKRVMELANANINSMTPAELETRARKELNGNEYRLLVNILKSRTREDYDADGNYVGGENTIEGNLNKRERKPEKKYSWVANQLQRFTDDAATQTEPQTETQTEPQTAPATTMSEPASEPAVQETESGAMSTVSQRLTDAGAKHTEAAFNRDFDSNYWKIRDHGFSTVENLYNTLNDNLDTVVEDGVPSVFENQDVGFGNNVAAWRQALGTMDPVSDELVVFATTAPIGSKKFSSEPMMPNPKTGQLDVSGRAPIFSTDVTSMQQRAKLIDGNVYGSYVRAESVYPWTGNKLSREQELQLAEWAGAQGYDGVMTTDGVNMNYIPSKTGTTMGTQLSVAKSSGRLQKDKFYSRAPKRDVSSMEMESIEKVAKTLGIPEGSVNITTSDKVDPDSADAHGYYDATTGGVTIIADNISSPEQAKWVLWHELSHRILHAGRLAAERSSIIRQATGNEFVSNLAKAIQLQRRGHIDNAATDFDVAVEEAIVELSSAVKSDGGINSISKKYGIEPPRALQKGFRGFVNRLYQRIRNVVSKVFGGKRLTDIDMYDLANTKMSRRNLLDADTDFRRSNQIVADTIDSAIDKSVAIGLPNIDGFDKYRSTTDEYGTADYGSIEPYMRRFAQLLRESDGVFKLYRAEHNDVTTEFAKRSSENSGVVTDYGYFGRGPYLTTSKQMALAYAFRGNRPVYEARTNVTNPFIWLGGPLHASSDVDPTALTNWALENGFDAIISAEIDTLSGAKPDYYDSLESFPLEFVAIKPGTVQGSEVDFVFNDSSEIEVSSKGNANNLYYSRGSNNQDVLDFSRTGRSSDPDEGIFGTGEKTWGGVVKKFARGIEERISDDLVPVKTFLKSLNLDVNTEQRVVGDLYLADGRRASKASELENKFMRPFFAEVNSIAKKHGYDYKDAKRIVGFWMSARYAKIKNQDFIDQDTAAVRDAQDAYNNNPTNDNYDKLREARLKLAKRQADINNPDAAATNFEVGVAGGYNNVKADTVMRNLENLVPRQDIEAAAQHIYDLQAARLDIDLESGRISQQDYNTYKQNPYYVPLTGDPRADNDFDDVINTGGQAINQQAQKRADGRTESMAEDGVDATWKSVSRSLGYYGYSDFKNGIRVIYDSVFQKHLSNGLSDADAHTETYNETGIKRSPVTMQRTSDAVLMIQENGGLYAYKLPHKVMDALQHNNRENTNTILKLAEVPTRAFARAVTQFYPAFAPINFARDAWERSTVLRTRTVYDQQGNKVDMDKVSNNMLKRMTDPRAFRDSIFWADPDGKTQRSRNLQDLIRYGGLSTHGTFLARTEKDLVKRIAREGRIDKKVLDGTVQFVEAYNRAFDLLPPLAAYESLLEAGVAPKDAAAATLDTMNFRKQGRWMRPIKALYMFAQPTATGFVNLAKQLSTKKGAIQAAAYYATMLGLYELIRASGDEEEAGNKIDTMGDITRFIPIPNPADPGKYFKFPVGFGLPQLMWNMATNTSRAYHGDITWDAAATNMASHMSKVVIPVSPSDIPADEHLGAKMAMTATPTILQPFMQLVLDRTPFGSKLTPQYVDKGKLKAEQSKSTTAPEWKDMAIAIQRITGIDMHAEEVKALWDGYSGMLGPLRDITKIAIENPNRERLGKEKFVPMFNSLYGPGNEHATQQRYYEAFDKARAIKNEYESRKERRDLGKWMTPEIRKQLNWFERADNELRKINQRKAKITKAYNKGHQSDEVYKRRVDGIAKQTERVQAKYLHEWRKMEGLNTKRGKQ